METLGIFINYVTSKAFPNISSNFSDSTLAWEDLLLRVAVGILRIAAGSAVIFLFLAQILIILVNLLPLFDVEEMRKTDSWSRAVDARKGERIRR
jgi:hypothetical protein